MSHYAALPKTVALALPITLGALTVQAADLIQTAEHVGRFNGFLQLLEAAGMVEVLEGEGPFTVFAPIDEHVHHLSSRIPCYRLGEALRDHPELQGVSRLTLKESFRCLRLALWDEDQRRLVGFREARAQLVSGSRNDPIRAS